MNKAKLVAFAIVILIFLGLGYYLVGNYSDGYRAGTLIKVSKKGFIFKTYEGEMNLGMVLNEGNSPTAVSNIWPFSVRASDTGIIRSLESALMTGRRVKLHYREKFLVVPWRGDTKFMVYKVETN